MARKYKGKKLLGSLGPADDSLDIDGASLAAPTLTGAVTASGSITSTENLPASGDSLVSGSPVVPNTLVTLTTDREKSVRYARLTLAALSVSITAANDYGGTKICDLADKNIMILGCETDLVLTKAGTTNGLESDTDLNTAVGTAAASNATLSATMVDVIDIVANTADSLTHDMDAHSQANTPANMPLEVADSATAALYLNGAASITADDTFTATGTIDLFYIDLGNVTS